MPQKPRFSLNAGFAIRPSPPILMRWPCHDHRPEVILQSGNGWYTEPHYRFDIGFIEDEKTDLFK